ncbi:hypothetical protein ARSEF1564_004396 [Beauveria bassiana]
MSPISTKSSTSSPSLSLAPDHQHSLKRQQDRARRDSRLNARLRRHSNASFVDSAMMSPTDAIGNLGLASYSPTTHTAGPLIAESPQLMPTSSYVPSYNLASENSHGYSLPYQQPLPQSYHLPMDYSNGYIGANEFGPSVYVFGASHSGEQPTLSNANKPFCDSPRCFSIWTCIEPAEATMLGAWM